MISEAPNATNINRLIARISNEPPEHFLMRNWTCGMAHCLGGWAYVLALEDGHPETRHVTKVSAHFLNINWLMGEDLFAMADDGAVEPALARACARFKVPYSVDEANTITFDDLPVSYRRRAAVKVLTILRDEGCVDWGRALADALEA